MLYAIYYVISKEGIGTWRTILLGPGPEPKGPRPWAKPGARGQGPDLGQSQGLVKARPRNQKMFPPQNICFLS